MSNKNDKRSVDLNGSRMSDFANDLQELLGKHDLIAAEYATVVMLIGCHNFPSIKE